MCVSRATCSGEACPRVGFRVVFFPICFAKPSAQCGLVVTVSKLVHRTLLCILAKMMTCFTLPSTLFIRMGCGSGCILGFAQSSIDGRVHSLYEVDRTFNGFQYLLMGHCDGMV